MYRKYKQLDIADQFSQTIVTVEWLQHAITTNPNLKIIDGTFHMENSGRDARAEHTEKHIPGAVYFDINECADLSSQYNLPHMLPLPQHFEEYVGSRGISNHSHVVVYDNNPKFPIFSAQRVWWTFKVFGHERVSILEGGLKKWFELGGLVVNEPSVVTKASYVAKFNGYMVKSYEDIVKNIDTGEFQLADARPPGRFLGKAPEPIEGVKSGSIPKSINVPFMSLMDVENSKYKTKSEVLEYFNQNGVDMDAPLVFSCGSGLQASNLALAAYLCGKTDAAIYDGSWVEWYRRAPSELKQNLQED